MFCVLPFLVLSGVSLETAANFLLFLSVAIFREEENLSVMKTEFILLIIKFSELEVSNLNCTEVSFDFQRIISNSRKIHKVTVP